MSRYILITLCFMIAGWSIPARGVAQDGSFIEGLFRTIASAKAAREREEQAERERQRQRETALPQQTQSVPVPSSIFPPGPGGANARINTPKISPRPTDRPTDRSTRPDPNRRAPTSPGSANATRSSFPASPSIRVRSKEAADFVNQLVGFTSSADAMVAAMRARPDRSARLRAQLPEAYQLVADCRALINRCDGLANVSHLQSEYEQIDARWRKLSFELRAIDSLDASIRDPLRQCDRACTSLAKQLRIEPQFDRRALRDLMIKAATHMQCLEDDLLLCALPRQRVDTLTSNSRLLRQTLVREAERVERVRYEDAVTRFTDFAQRYGQFAERVATINDPHLRRRLDRISECGTATYALLWMTPPTPTIDLNHAADHLLQSVDDLLVSLNFSSLFRLPPQQQMQIVQWGRDLRSGAEHFQQEARGNPTRNDLVVCFGESERAWASLRPALASLPTFPPEKINAVDRYAGQIQLGLGISPGTSPGTNLDQLIELAAALEGSSEYLEADIKRYDRYLVPSSFRSTMLRAADDFHDESRRLHDQLSHGDDIRSLQKRTERVLAAWDQLSDGLSDIQNHGLSPIRAARLQRSQQEILPIVAGVAAALSTR